MVQAAFNILKSKRFIWLAVAVSAVFVGVAVYFASIPALVVFPNAQGFKYETYTDQAVGGTSQVVAHSVNDSVLKLAFRLDKSFHSPYVGLSITPIESKYINARRYTQISLKIKGTNIDRVGVALYTSVPGYVGEQTGDDALYNSYLNISGDARTYKLPISQFTHPEWSKDLHHVAKSDENKPDKRKILHINIGSASTPNVGNEMVLEIYSLSFTRNMRSLIILLLLLEISFLFVLFLINFAISSIKTKPAPVTVFNKPLEIDAKQLPNGQ